MKKRVINAHTHSSLYSRENPRQEIATPNQYPFFSKAQDLSVEKKSRIFPVKLFFFIIIIIIIIIKEIKELFLFLDVFELLSPVQYNTSVLYFFLSDSTNTSFFVTSAS